MPMINTVTLEGWLQDDPKMIGDENPVAVFTIRVPGGGYERGSTESKSMWIDCKAFRKTAENVLEKAAKGTHVFLTGSLQQEFFTRKDDSKGKDIRMIVNNARFINDSAERDEEENKVEVIAPAEEAEVFG